MVHSDIVLSGDLSANLLWLETFIKTLDNMDANLHRLFTCSLLFLLSLLILLYTKYSFFYILL